MRSQAVKTERNYRILIVEDDQDLLGLLTLSLEQNAYQVTGISCASLIPQSFQGVEFDLVILDFLMPGYDGFETLTKVRTLSRTPIMILTSLGAKDVLSKCLALGADEYVTKPFNFSELFARIRALIRLSYSSRPHVPLSNLSSGAPGLTPLPTLIHSTKSVLVQGVNLPLTSKEYQFLDYFFSMPNQVIPTQQLLVDIWGTANCSPSSITNIVGRIRKKIEADPSNPQVLVTVRSQGYMLRLAE